MTSSAIRYTPRSRVTARSAGQKLSGATMPLVPALGSISTAATCAVAALVDDIGDVRGGQFAALAHRTWN